jgi:cytochrome P450
MTTLLAPERVTTPESPLTPLTPIPVKPGLPLLGDLFSFTSDPLGFLQRTPTSYPDLVAIKMLGSLFYQVNHPDLIEQVLVTQNQHFIKDKGLKVAGRPVFGDGLLSSDGDFWLRQRRMAQPAFHRQRIAAYADYMTAYAAETLAGWRDGEERDLYHDMMHLTLRIVAKTLFDVEANAEVDEIGDCLDAIMWRFDNQSVRAMLEQATGWSVPTPGLKRYHRSVQRLDEIVDNVIAQRRRSHEDKGDLLGMLLAARDDDGNGMSDAQLRDECKTMFLAGHETTALTLSWTWWLLWQNPDAAAKLRAELDTVLQGRVPTLADVPQLPYTDRVIRESMRLMPPAWTIVREAIADVELVNESGVRYPLPKGHDVVISQYAVHRDGRWYPNPDRFDPDRWTPEFTKSLPKYAYFPFGGGPRLCIGQQFAMMEAILILAMIAQRYELELVPGQRIEPQPSITMRPKYGMKMRVRARM